EKSGLFLYIYFNFGRDPRSCDFTSQSLRFSKKTQKIFTAKKSSLNSYAEH
ncbi:MAG: hypothetical protein ACI9CZ_001475, partial [Flavobacterium sp.]